ncbi:MAG: chemotaxis protein CheX [Oligoflexus sp.]|nr:chemotaxis protein CheX [Oligoflexus sp.]
MAQKNLNNAKIIVVMSNLDMRMSTSQFLSKRPWADVQNILGFDLMQVILSDERFDMIFTDAEEGSGGGMVNFLKLVRLSRRNASTLVICVHAARAQTKHEELLSDKLFRYWTQPLSLISLDELKADIDAAKLKAQAASAAAQIATPSKSFDVRLLNAVVVAVGEVLNFYFLKDTVDFGKPQHRKQPLLKRSGITGLISIEGEKFKGSMALTASLDFLQHFSNKIFPDQDIKLTKEGAIELIAELSNQLVGRIKMRFGDLGLSSNIGLPEVFIGKNHSVPHKVIDSAIFIGLKVLGSLCELELTISQAVDFIIDETKTAMPAKGVLMFE